MSKNLISWILSTVGVASIVFSLVLLFPVDVKAYCTVFATCPNGGSVSCSGDTCQSSGNCVTCRFNNNPVPESKCCGGGDN